MNVEVLPDAAAVATHAARFTAAHARDAVSVRGQFAFALLLPDAAAAGEPIQNR
jgi:hypothetical protein